MLKLAGFILMSVLTSTFEVAAAPPIAVPIWKGAVPGENGEIGEERDTTTAKDNLIAGRPVIRLGNVSIPTMTVYKAPKNKDTGATVVVFPGGGYNILAMDLEGTEVCEWLNSIGVTGVLLKYRVPARKGGPRYAAPLQDAQRVMGIVRSQAKEWGIDPNRIGVLGFSAGAHLAATLSNNYEKRTYQPADDADGVNCRPDFVVLIYPGGLVNRNEGDKLGPELSVSANTPPTFIVQTEDDGVRVENSLVYYQALRQAKVPAEMHLYPRGGHGYGLRRTSDAVTTWPLRAEEWMRSLGVLQR